MKLSKLNDKLNIEKILGHYYNQLFIVKLKDGRYAELSFTSQSIYVCDGIFPFIRTQNLNIDIPNKALIWAERLINNPNARVYKIENYFPNEMLEDIFTENHINYLRNIGIEI